MTLARLAIQRCDSFRILRLDRPGIARESGAMNRQARGRAGLAAARWAGSTT